jgi:2-amino-4-hydroxy-6-hydroxymethyldihydropteridine diphosphokinase
MIAVIALGSNEGDRLQYLKNAVLALESLPVIKITKKSNIYQSQAVGGVTEKPFLNAVIEVQTELTPHQLLKVLQEIENQNGRIRKEKWGDRTLDLDLISVENEIIESEELTIPHRLAHQRSFVLIPLYEIDPAANLPKYGIVKELIDQLGDQQLESYAKF